MEGSHIFVLVLLLGIAALFAWAEIKTRRNAARDDGGPADKK